MSVKAGATVIESPVCIPIGSIFSIEQTIILLSFLSLTTSISNSFQPTKDSSTKTSLVGDRSRPFFTISKNSSLVFATPPPVPPRVKDGLMIDGIPILLNASLASSSFLHMKDFADSKPISFMFFLNFSLFSALSIASAFAPISSTLYFFKIPFSFRLMAAFKPV